MPDVKIYAGNPFRSQPVPPVRSLQVVIVRQICDLCARGAGLKVITKTLNAKRDTEGQKHLTDRPSV